VTSLITKAGYSEDSRVVIRSSQSMLEKFFIYFIIIIIISGVRLSPLGTAAIIDLLYKPQMIDEGDCGAIGGMKISRGNRSIREKTCLNTTLSTTNPTYPDPATNPSKPATNRLSYGTANVGLMP
jgi:hypothetical protein